MQSQHPFCCCYLIALSSLFDRMAHSSPDLYNFLYNPTITSSGYGKLALYISVFEESDKLSSCMSRTQRKQSPFHEQSPERGNVFYVFVPRDFCRDADLVLIAR